MEHLTTAELLAVIKEHNDAMQAQFTIGTSGWHSHETIDDILHELLKREEGN